MTDEQKAKLPAYARHYIAKLEADLQAAAANVYAVERGETNTVVGSDYDEMRVGYLPPHQHVTFRLANGSRLECHVSRHDGDVLEVYAYGKRAQIVVAPRVGNSIEVSTK